ncbi:MAG: hypothetical protein PHU85_00570 [Phycisphaerae bacterium]|nr:hypothetical protein [Phycisphaerae bacterium]
MYYSTAVANALDRIMRLRPDKAQFVRHDKSLRHIRAEKLMLKGEKAIIKVETSAAAGAVPVGDPVTAEQLEFPAARSSGHSDITIEWSHLAEIRQSVRYTGLAEQQTKDLKTAIYKAALKMVRDVDLDMAHTVSSLLHSNGDCVLAKVDTVYVEDGSATWSGNGNTAYIKIKEGAIGNFIPGQVLDFRAVSDNDNVRVTAYVRDVFAMNEGPDGTRGRGPGIRVTLHADNLGVGDTDFDNVAPNDEITFQGAKAYNFSSLPVWFSTAAVCGITRTSSGSAWAVPHIKWFDASGDGTGTKVTLDLETHLGELAQELADAVIRGRAMRDVDSLSISEGYITMIARPPLCSEFSKQVGDGVRYTDTLDKEGKKKLFGTSGFDGGFWHDPLLGPIAFQPDPKATPGTIRMLDTGSWMWVIGHTGSGNSADGIPPVEWVEENGNRFFVERGANGRVKNVKTGGCFMRLQLVSDAPRSNAQLGGLKSDLGNS